MFYLQGLKHPQPLSLTGKFIIKQFWRELEQTCTLKGDRIQDIYPLIFYLPVHGFFQKVFRVLRGRE